MKNYYEILEINEHASQEVIEKAYRVLVRKYHPDLYKGEEKVYAEQKVRDINEAYKVLSDDFLKSQYDMELQRVKNKNFYNSQNETDKNINSDEGRKKKTAQRPNIKFEWNNREKDEEKPVKKNNIGSIGSIIDLLKEIIKARPNKVKKEKISKLDLIAFELTIVILIIIGIILWFIPFTNGWMRQLIFENPLFIWIWNLF